MQGGDGDAQHKQVAHHKLDAMLGLCELTTCRRQALLAYFGEQLADPCGNCDNCLHPPQTWDGSEAARMALSCVYRSGQRFGVNYLIEILRGSDNERIRHNGHDRLSTHGIGKALETAEWRAVFRQLIARGYLAVDLEGYGALRLTAACRPLLRGEAGLELRKLRRPSRASGRRKTATLSSRDDPLFEALRDLRRRLAEAQGVPPYVIFHDATLREMAARRPLTERELLEISGVGEQKLRRYGAPFLALLRERAGTDAPQEA